MTHGKRPSSIPASTGMNSRRVTPEAALRWAASFIQSFKKNHARV